MVMAIARRELTGELMSIPVNGWVVYEMLERGQPCGRFAVCDTAEWNQLEAARPGAYPLIRAGIVNETEAEQLARSTTVSKQPAKP